MLRNSGIAFKLTVLSITFSAIILIGIFGFNYVLSRDIIKENIEKNAKTLVESAVNKIDGVLEPVRKVPESLAAFLEEHPVNQDELLGLLRKVFEQNPNIFGMAVAYEPYAFERDSRYFAPYFYRSKGESEFTYLGGETYRYFYSDWYQIARETGLPQWSEPYYDEGGGGIIMATYSVPFYKTVDGKKVFMGVVTADLSLESLSAIVSSIKILRTGDGFLISRNGAYVTHRVKQLIMNETIFGIAEARNNPSLREIGRKMVGGETGFARYASISTGRPSFIYYAPIKSNGWSVGVVFPEAEFTEDIDRISRIIVVLGGAGLLLLSIAVILIAGTITRPLKAMVHAAVEIGSGHFDVELPSVDRGDEVGKLSKAFRLMRQSLKEYIARLTETTATKERMESELKIAHDIQMGILPKIFPPFPSRKEFDIFAVIKPAKEVGGDFYDFFQLDEHHICFVIADVSGKGVPASLFMAVTKTLIKATASQESSPGEILTRVNKELSSDNDSGMFVTIFLGILNTMTGEVTFANGGHNPPLLIRRDEGISFINPPPGLVVGALDGFVYSTDSLILRKGDAVFMYTDGVTEAMNAESELFSEERLVECLSGLRGKSIKAIVSGVDDCVQAYVKEEPQSDDITILVVEYRGEG